MIFRPVRPQSPSGPPVTNFPVGFTWNSASGHIQPLGSVPSTIGHSMRLMSAWSRSSTCWVDTTTLVASTGLPSI